MGVITILYNLHFYTVSIHSILLNIHFFILNEYPFLLPLLIVIAAIVFISMVLMVLHISHLKNKVFEKNKKLLNEIKLKNIALKKAKESEANYISLFEYSALSKWIYDIETLKFLRVNQTAIDHYGYSREEFLNMTIKDIRPKEEIPKLLETNRQKIKKGDTTFYGVWKHLKKNGEIIMVEVYGTPIIFENRECKTISCNDITEQFENERILTDFAENLERKVEIRTEELIQAHSVLVEQHEQITHSINYARKIQYAIFPKKEEFYNDFPNSFIFFKPKDVVSGDFYWYYKKDNKRFLIVADCTGHGVPGAMLSMVGHQLLNQIIFSWKIYSPAEILTTLDNEIRKLFNHTVKNSPNDGMDAIVCQIDSDNKTIYYAGAKNSLIYISDQELKEIRGSKKSVGGDPRQNRESYFEEHTIKYNNNDYIYLSTDGYADQFGGNENKKIMKKGLKNLLYFYKDSPLKTQCTEVANFFETWKGENEQIDDVLLIGIGMSAY